MPAGQIIAIGGVRGPEHAPLYRYVLEQAASPRPRIGFLATAKGDSEISVDRFHEAFGELRCEPSHLALFDRTPDLDGWFGERDVILVGGGNTKSMLAVWREWGIDERLRRAWESGTVLAGWSAGAICWFEEGVTDSWAGRLEAVPCLGFLEGSCCPHYDGEPERRPAYRRLVGRAEMAAGIAVDDGAAVHFRGAEATRVVATSDSANAWSVSPAGGGASEAPLAVERVRID